jgi:RND family efflux transporter MFP subunit
MAIRRLSILKLFLALTALAFDAAGASAQMRYAGSMAQRDLDGVIQPSSDIEVASVEMGIVREILVKPGDHVVRGQPLVYLDSETVEAQIRVKQAEAESTGKLAQAQGELAIQQSKFDKLSTLLLDGKSSHNEVERAQLDLLVAKGRLQSEVESMRVLKSDLERFQRQLDDRIIRAPIDGIVTDMLKEVGEIVSATSPSVLRVIDTRKLRATFSVQESELASLPIGKVVHLQLSNGGTVDGTVEYVPPVADPETGWFMINVVIDNQDGKIIGSRCTRLP